MLYHGLCANAWASMKGVERIRTLICAQYHTLYSMVQGWRGFLGRSKQLGTISAEVEKLDITFRASDAFADWV